MNRNYKMTGFTLIELMIVIAVIGIIVAIAYPAYRDTVLKSRRSDAQTGLQACAIAQERWYTRNSTYANQGTVDANCTADGTETALCSCKNTNDGYYNIAIPNGSFTQTSFTAVATPSSKGVQTDDISHCKSLSLTQAGEKLAIDGSNNAAVAACWGG